MKTVYWVYLVHFQHTYVVYEPPPTPPPPPPPTETHLKTTVLVNSLKWPRPSTPLKFYLCLLFQIVTMEEKMLVVFRNDLLNRFPFLLKQHAHSVLKLLLVYRITPARIFLLVKI